jgi:hypothetical protein
MSGLYSFCSISCYKDEKEDGMDILLSLLLIMTVPCSLFLLSIVMAMLLFR